MPRIRTIKSEHKSEKKSASNHSSNGHAQAAGGAHKKRRPGRDSEHNHEASAQTSMLDDAADVKVVDVDETHSHDHGAGHESAEHVRADSAHEDSSSDDKNLEINFPGSEILRAKFPKSFDAVETLASDWMRDSDFSNLPLPQGPVKEVVQKSLRKAKDIEKQVMASPVTEKVAMQAFTYAIKAQGYFNKIKDRIKK